MLEGTSAAYAEVAASLSVRQSSFTDVPPLISLYGHTDAPQETVHVKAHVYGCTRVMSTQRDMSGMDSPWGKHSWRISTIYRHMGDGELHRYNAYERPVSRSSSSYCPSCP